MNRNFNNDLEQNLEDPEFIAYFYNARQESLKELIKIVPVDFTTQVNKILYSDWGSKDELEA